MRLIEKFARHCGLADAEKNWLLKQVGEAAGNAEPAGAPTCNAEENPSQQELDAFDAVLRGLLEGRGEPVRPERAALRAKVARGCLRGFDQEGLFLADETIVAAVGALHSIGAFEPDDVHHLATFLGQAAGSPMLDPETALLDPQASQAGTAIDHLASVCEELVRLESLTAVHRLDLILAMLACFDLPQAARLQVLEAVVAGDALPHAVGMEILQRVLLGKNLYRPYYSEDSDEYFDARPVWLVAGDDPQRQDLADSLGALVGQLTLENRDRARAEMVEVDEMLDWLDSDEGTDLLEELACQVAGRLPEFMQGEHAEPHEEPCGFHSSSWQVAPELAPMESDVQLACEEHGAPHRAPEALLVGLSQMLEELWHEGVEPVSFASEIANDETGAEAVLLDTVDHVLDCSLPDSVHKTFFLLGMLGAMGDDDVERLRETALAARDGLRREVEVTVPADLVELLAPFEPRTAARLNRTADEDLTFAACRLLVQNGAESEEVARAAGAFWNEHSFALAGPDAGWCSRFIVKHAALFAAEVVSAAKGKSPVPADSGAGPAGWLN